MVKTSNSHLGSPGLNPQESQIYSPLLLQSWRVETMGEEDHEVMCR